MGAADYRSFYNEAVYLADSVWRAHSQELWGRNPGGGGDKIGKVFENFTFCFIRLDSKAVTVGKAKARVSEDFERLRRQRHAVVSLEYRYIHDPSPRVPTRSLA
jgi:hypothetical protein